MFTLNHRELNVSYKHRHHENEDDGELVSKLLQPFENRNCLFYNPDRDGLPGQPIMRGLIEKGMEQSKITMLFITKKFLSDELCMFMANLAIWKYMKTKGIHRVLPIILQPCKIPRYLKVLNCIHVWKYATTRSSHMLYKTQAITRLTKAMLDPPPKFRRIRWNGIKTLTWTRNIVEKVKKSALKEKASNQSIHNINLFQLWRLIGVLKHCFLNCRYGHCSFACSGREFTRFIGHAERCRYRPIKCPNKSCQTFLPKWCVDKHVEECPLTRLTCPSTMLREEEAFHLDACEMAEVSCPNIGCGRPMARNKIKQHNLDCLLANISCPNSGRGCKTRDKRIRIQNHTSSCPFRLSECEFCGRKLTFQKLNFHIKNCKKTTICQLCKIAVPRLDVGTHERMCQRKYCLSRCEVCHKYVRTDTLEDHKKLCMEYDHTPQVEQLVSDLPDGPAHSPQLEQPPKSEPIDIHHSSHRKIKRRSGTSNSNLDNGRPQTLKDYMKSLRFTDSTSSSTRNENNDPDFRHYNRQGNFYL
ncbi:unnamed protein product [Mytilus edulis]|uniref:TRAF-type domain-containing protein n=1 Tax=Mytilus edulis TaxID=6550 RepID=A0A8S3R4H9_MYTED|nr:unnamed protein product [Mytilus edulis]